MGIGEVIRRLLANLILSAGGEWDKDVYRSVNLCSGTKANIEGGIHMVCERVELVREDKADERRMCMYQDEEGTYGEEVVRN